MITVTKYISYTKYTIKRHFRLVQLVSLIPLTVIPLTFAHFISTFNDSAYTRSKLHGSNIVDWNFPKWKTILANNFQNSFLFNFCQFKDVYLWIEWLYECSQKYFISIKGDGKSLHFFINEFSDKTFNELWFVQYNIPPLDPNEFPSKTIFPLPNQV